MTQLRIVSSTDHPNPASPPPVGAGAAAPIATPALTFFEDEEPAIGLAGLVWAALACLPFWALLAWLLWK